MHTTRRAGPVRLSEPYWTMLHGLAEWEERPVAEVLRRALRHYVRSLHAAGKEPPVRVEDLPTTPVSHQPIRLVIDGDEITTEIMTTKET